MARLLYFDIIPLYDNIFPYTITFSLHGGIHLKYVEFLNKF